MLYPAPNACVIVRAKVSADTVFCWLAGKIIDYEVAAAKDQYHQRQITVRYFPNQMLRPIELMVDDVYMVGTPSRIKYWRLAFHQFPKSEDLITTLHGMGFATTSQEAYYSHHSGWENDTRYKGVETQVTPPPGKRVLTSSLVVYHSPVEYDPKSKTFSKDVVV